MNMLQGRSALVTGASRGIGRATPLALADAGARACALGQGSLDHRREHSGGRRIKTLNRSAIEGARFGRKTYFAINRRSTPANPPPTSGPSTGTIA
jgi:NAD(P)-dependent dehydrogenase (short-subunit alcohol dehydrogenase family)